MEDQRMKWWGLVGGQRFCGRGLGRGVGSLSKLSPLCTASERSLSSLLSGFWSRGRVMKVVVEWPGGWSP